MSDDFDHITCRTVADANGPNVDSSGNRFSIVPDSVTWYTDPEYAKFCGCGSPEEIDEALVDYLSGLDHESWDDRPSLQEQYDRCGGQRAFLFCAYVSDALGWTEHGGSIYGAWLEPAGRTALKALTANKGSSTE